MKIALCSQTNDMNALVDSRFGRAAYFALFDDETKQWEFIPNDQNLQAAQGAGIQAAQTVIDTYAEVLIASNVGPKAMTALTANGIAVYKVTAGMTVEQALKDYQNDKLKQIQLANVEGHWV